MNFRRLGKYICTLSLAAAMSVTTMGATVISDVATTHWAYQAVSDLEERGIMVLTSNGQFYPNQTMNYFEVADVIAKATGYVDVDIVTNIDETFKQQIKNNYEKQKATLEQYASKYSTWNSAYNQQIAYLLGRGYMNTSDLDKFITKSASGETKNIVTKEQLSVYIVRMLGKEVTAKNTYKTTTFSDDSTLNVNCKPYVEYLRSVGLINPDAAGKANGTMKVTKALCAKMVSDSLKINDTTQVGKVNNQTTPTTPSDTNATTQTYTVGKVLTKNTSEYYILLQDGTGKSSYYSFKATSPIKDVSGAPLAITKLVSGTTVNATIELQGDVQYITSIEVTSSATNQETGSNTSGTTTPEQTITTGNTKIVSGTLLTEIKNEIIRISLADGSSQVYLINDQCVTTLDGVTVASTDSLKAGASVTVTLVNNAVTQITATSATASTNTSTDSQTSTSTNNIGKGELAAKKFVGNKYVLTLGSGSTAEQVTVSTSAKVTRNGKKSDLTNVRIGDAIKVTRENGEVTAIEATGERATVEATIKGVYISSNSQLIVTEDNKEVAYTIANDVEVYDNNTREYISIRDLHLGQEVTLLVDSKEVLTIDVEKTNTTYNLMGTIVEIGKNYNYIDVLVDYDYVSGESKVYKRVETPSDLVVMIDGKSKNRKELDEDMDIVINYKYLDDTVPEKILVLS